MSLLDDVSIVVTPNGYKAGTLYGVLPTYAEGAEMLSQPVDLQTDFTTHSGGVIVDADTFTTSGGSLDGIKKSSFLTVGTRYKLIIEGNTTSSGFTMGNFSASGNEYGSGFGTHIFTASVDTTLWLRQNTAGTTNITSFTVKEVTSADMDVTRATAGTRVDENGLVNYAEIIGGEEIEDGNFPSGTTAWSFQSGWSMGDGVAIATSGSGTAGKLTQTNTLNGIYAEVTLTVSNYGGSGLILVDFGSVSSSYITSDGTHTLYGTYDQNNFEIYKTDDFSGNVTSISVKEVTRDNVPRIDYTGGGCPHILAEPQRTNLMPYSEDFSGSSWTKSYVTVTSDSVNSLDGNLNADLILETSAADRHIFWDNTLASGGDYTVSIFLKKQNNRYVFFQSGVDNASTRYGIIYDFDGGVVTDTNSKGSPTNTSYKVEQHINGWVKLSITQTHTSGDVYLICGGSDAAIPTYNIQKEPVYTGNASNGFYAWGAQVEEGSYSTSYIPTSGSTVTRNQDIFTRDGIGSLINSTEGVLFAELSALANDGTFRVISLSDGTSSNRLWLYFTVGSNLIQVFDGTTIIAYTIVVTNMIKVAVVYDSNGARMWVNGLQVGSNSYVGFSGFDRLNFDDGAGGNKFFGKVKQLQVYNTALTDEQLLQLTGTSGTDFYESYAEMASALTYTIQ